MQYEPSLAGIASASAEIVRTSDGGMLKAYLMPLSRDPLLVHPTSRALCFRRSVTGSWVWCRGWCRWRSPCPRSAPPTAPVSPPEGQWRGSKPVKKLWFVNRSCTNNEIFWTRTMNRYINLWDTSNFHVFWYLDAEYIAPACLTQIHTHTGLYKRRLWTWLISFYHLLPMPFVTIYWLLNEIRGMIHSQILMFRRICIRLAMVRWAVSVIHFLAIIWRSKK